MIHSNDACVKTKYIIFEVYLLMMCVHKDLLQIDYHATKADQVILIN